MEAESQSSVEAAQERQVPEALLQKLHDATERFHQAKRLLEDAIGDSQYSHQQTIDKAAEDLRGAERDVEEISLEIRGSLKPPPPMPPNH